MTEESEIRIKLTGQGEINKQGKFEVDAITVGEGNGWMFTENALRDSLALWDNVECFVDHGDWFSNTRSIKDLGGVFHNPRWNDENLAIRIDLNTMGPSAELIDELGKQILSEPLRPRVGFSADVLFTAKNKEVQRILRVFEIDLVFNPARGGAFVRALNSINSPGVRGKEVSLMQETEVRSNTATSPAGDGKPIVSGEETGQVNLTQDKMLQKDLEAIKTLVNVQAEREKLAKEAEAARAVRVQMCGYLLESGLSAAHLPKPMADTLRKQFNERVFEPQELTQAIDDARKLISDLAGAGVVQGPAGRIHGMYNTDDQLQAAVDDMLGASREKGSENLKVARLSGIKELYMMMTGDRELYGGYFADRVQLATTTNFSGLVKNALNKLIAESWAQLGAAGYDWWQRIVRVEHFETLNSITGIIVGTVGTLPSIAEGAEYSELKVGDSPETASFTKYGGYIPLTLELIDRDETRKLRQYPRELAKAGIRLISSLVAAVFTDNSAIGPLMADGGYLFNNTAVTTLTGHANLLTTALAAAQWEVVKIAMYNQPLLIANETGYYGTGSKMAIKPRYLLVPINLKLTAKKILYPDWENASNIHSENMQKQRMDDVVVVPEWTDASDWAAVADPALVPGIVVCERFGLRPEIFIAGDEQSPAVFSNDEHRMKVRHYLAVVVVDFRPLHKSNV